MLGALLLVGAGLYGRVRPAAADATGSAVPGRGVDEGRPVDAVGDPAADSDGDRSTDAAGGPVDGDRPGAGAADS